MEDVLLPQNESNEDSRHYEDDNEEEVTLTQNAQTKTRGIKEETGEWTKSKEITTENRNRKDGRICSVQYQYIDEATRENRSVQCHYINESTREDRNRENRRLYGVQCQYTKNVNREDNNESIHESTNPDLLTAAKNSISYVLNSTWMIGEKEEG